MCACSCSSSGSATVQRQGPGNGAPSSSSSSRHSHRHSVTDAPHDAPPNARQAIPVVRNTHIMKEYPPGASDVSGGRGRGAGNQVLPVQDTDGVYGMLGEIILDKPVNHTLYNIAPPISKWRQNSVRKTHLKSRIKKFKPPHFISRAPQVSARPQRPQTGRPQTGRPQTASCQYKSTLDIPPPFSKWRRKS